MTPVVLLPTTSTYDTEDIIGDPVKASSWYGIPGGIHTIAVYVQNFSGILSIEGSLSLDGKGPWFPLKIEGNDYMEFPRNPKAATSIRGGDTGVVGVTIQANVVFLRARVSRSYLSKTKLTPEQVTFLGSIRHILICM